MTSTRSAANRWKWITRPMLVITALAAVTAAGIMLRALSFWARGSTDSEPFWAESAQHYRYTKATTESGIPEIDYDIQRPEGMRTATQSILGEQIVGFCYRKLGGTNLQFFIRWFVRAATSLCAVAVFVAAREMGFSVLSALFSACGYALAFPALTRSLGDTYLHEHTAILFFSFHYCFLVSYLRRSKLLLLVPILATLIAAMLCWKVMIFIFAVETVGLICLWLALGGSRQMSRSIASLQLATVSCIVLVCLTTDTYLRWDKVHYSIGVVLSGGLFIAAAGWYFIQKWRGYREERRNLGLRIITIILVLTAGIIIHYLTEAQDYRQDSTYGHVWSTLAYRLRYWTKPVNPALLPFEVRHYWVPPYTSPNLFELCDEHLFFLSLVLGGLAFTVKHRRQFNPQSFWFIFFMTCLWLPCFLLFSKLKTILTLVSAPFIAGWVGVPGSRKIFRITAGTIMIAAQVYQTLFWQDSVISNTLFRLGLDYPKDAVYSKVTTGQAVSELLGWIEQSTPPESTILCEFVLAPVILTYTGRGTNLNAYFEGDQRRKFQDFAEALFKDEEHLAKLCAKWKTSYLVYNAHMLMRTDSNLSFRYIVDAMKLSEATTAYKFHFRPQELKSFQLVAQNHFFRIYKVLHPGEKPEPQRSFKYQALFDEKLFLARTPRTNGGEPLTQEWFYPFIMAYQYYEEALYSSAREDTPNSIKLLQRSLKQCNLIADVHRDLALALLRQKDSVAALASARNALALNDSDPVARKLVENLTGRREFLNQGVIAGAEDSPTHQ